MVGDLDYAGLSGKIYTPASGNGIPGIAFGHDWTKSVKKYHQTLRHLASWGIAVAASNTETGLLPNHSGLAEDLESCLQILAGVKLGHGAVTVSPEKLGIAGHGMGGGAAILTATKSDDVRAVGVAYPAETSPSCRSTAFAINVPGLIIGAAENGLLEASSPAKIAVNWGGDIVYREIKKGNQQGFAEDSLYQFLLGIGFPQYSAQETVRGLLTGFFLYHLDGDSKYKAFADPDAQTNKVISYSGSDLQKQAYSAETALLPNLLP